MLNVPLGGSNCGGGSAAFDALRLIAFCTTFCDERGESAVVTSGRSSSSSSTAGSGGGRATATHSSGAVEAAEATVVAATTAIQWQQHGGSGNHTHDAGKNGRTSCSQSLKVQMEKCL
jgi:hypothetical protein